MYSLQIFKNKVCTYPGCHKWSCCLWLTTVSVQYVCFVRQIAFHSTNVNFGDTSLHPNLNDLPLFALHLTTQGLKVECRWVNPSRKHFKTFMSVSEWLKNTSFQVWERLPNTLMLMFKKGVFHCIWLFQGDKTKIGIFSHRGIGLAIWDFSNRLENK